MSNQCCGLSGYITGNAEALHCRKTHVQSQWEWVSFDIKIPDFFSNLNFTSMITSPKSTSGQIFILIHSAGASPQIGEILRFVTFFLLGYTVFFSGTRPGQTRGWIFKVYGSYDVFSPKDGPLLGLQQYLNSFGVRVLKISPKGA